MILFCDSMILSICDIYANGLCNKKGRSGNHHQNENSLFDAVKLHSFWCLH